MSHEGSRRKRGFITFTVVLTVLMIAVFRVVFGPTLETGEVTKLVMAEVHYPGVPIPTTQPGDRYCTYVPELVIWADGFAFLDVSLVRKPDVIRVGKLKAETIAAVGNRLMMGGFYAGWLPLELNPAGTMLRLTGQSGLGSTIERVTGNLDETVYTGIQALVAPELHLMPDQGAVDTRVTQILDAYLGCNEYAVGP